MRSLGSPEVATSAYIHFMKTLENVAEYSIPLNKNCVQIESIGTYGFNALDMTGSDITGLLNLGESHTKGDVHHYKNIYKGERIVMS